MDYNLHVLLRFDLERDLIAGRLEVSDLEEAWNARFFKDFGVKVDKSSNGVLQDVHWSEGLMGYFPTYTLGNVYAGVLHAALRRDVPDLAIRSTFIVGFPGETEDDFQQLLDFMVEARIDRAGCFKYEDVKGAASHDLPDHVPEEVKEERWHRFMQAQQEISHERSQAQIGRTLDVIIDDANGTDAVGRTSADAPEIDGLVNIENWAGLKPGDIVQAKITDADFYDLWAEKPE